MFIDSGGKCGGALTQFPESCIEPDPCSQGAPSSGPDASYIYFVPWDFDNVGTHAYPPRTSLSHLNQLSTIPARFAGLGLDACDVFAIRYLLIFHEDQKTLTLLATSTGAPIFVDEPRGDAQREPKSITQKPHPITNAYKDTRLPSATPGIHLSISSLSQTALEPIVPFGVMLPLPSKSHENGSPLGEDYGWKHPSKGSFKGQLTNKLSPVQVHDHEKVDVLFNSWNGLASQIALDGNSVSLSKPSTPPLTSPIYEIRTGSFTFEVSHKSKSGLIINSQTLLSDEVATTEKIPIPLRFFVPTVAIGSNIITLSSLAASTPGPRLQTITLDSKAFVLSELYPLAIMIDSQTLTAGEVITAKGSPVSLPGANNAFAVGDRTLALPSLHLSTPGLHINEAIINSLTFLVSELPSSAVLIGSQTLTPGNRIIVQDEPISLLPKNRELLLGDRTVKLQPLTTPETSLSVGEVAIGSTTFNFSILSPSSIQIGSQILKPGGVITVNGHQVSFLLSTPTSTVERNIFPKPKVADVSVQTIALGKEKLLISHDPSSRIIIGTQRLAPGSAIVYHGKAISLPTSGSVIVAGSSTSHLLPVTVSFAPEAKESHSFELGQLSLSGLAAQVSDKAISSSTTVKSTRIPSSTARQENRFMSKSALATTAETATETATATATGTEGSTKTNGVAVSNRLKSHWKLISSLFLGGYIAACLL